MNVKVIYHTERTTVQRVELTREIRIPLGITDVDAYLRSVLTADQDRFWATHWDSIPNSEDHVELASHQILSADANQATTLED